MEFSSTAEYLRAFHVPLLEEVRAQLHQALQKSITQSEAPAIVRARVTKMIHTKAKNQDPSMRKFNLYLSRHSRRDTTVRSKDLILLCCGKLPKLNHEREGLPPRMHHKFLLVNVIFAREGSPVITATAYLPDGSPILEKLNSPSARRSEWFAVLLGMSLIPADRIWTSINVNNNSAPPASEMSVTQDLLQIYSQVMLCHQFRTSLMPYSRPHLK